MTYETPVLLALDDLAGAASGCDGNCSTGGNGSEPPKEPEAPVVE